MVLEAYRGALQAKRITPRDPILLQQMEATEMLAGKWEVPEKIHDDVAVSNYVANIALSQWYTGIQVRPPKLLLGDETSLVKDELDEARQIVRTAKGDVEEAISAHFKKIMRLIRESKGTPLVEVAGPGQGQKLDRLAGI